MPGHHDRAFRFLAASSAGDVHKVAHQPRLVKGGMADFGTGGHAHEPETGRSDRPRGDTKIWRSLVVGISKAPDFPETPPLTILTCSYCIVLQNQCLMAR